MIACATRLHEVQTSAEFGVGISGEVSVDFGKVMDRMRRIRSTISEVRERSRHELGVKLDVQCTAFRPCLVTAVGVRLKQKKKKKKPF